MEITRIVHMRAMKGLGFEWINKILEICLDDIDPGTTESEIIDIVTADAKQQMKDAGYLRYYITEIENA